MMSEAEIRQMQTLFEHKINVETNEARRFAHIGALAAVNMILGEDGENGPT